VYLLPLGFLPLATLSHPPDPASPVGSILSGLLRHVAVPFAALSTTAVVAQQWLARAGGHDPYRLYAASNWGSFVGLFAYPFLVEPLFTLRSQRLGWSAAYLLYLGLALVAFPRAAQAAPAPAADEPACPPPGWGQTAAWFGLALFPSALLLAVTNVVAMDVGSAPFVWVLPLGLYLLSFVFAFARGGCPWFVARFSAPLALVGLDFFCVQRGGVTVSSAAIHLGVLLFAAWTAHGELVRRRPAPRHLARFYLAIALGGWAGGVAVSLLAPALLSGLWEYPLALGGLAALLVALRWRDLACALERDPWPLLLGTLLLGSVVAAHVVVEQGLVPQRAPILVHRNAYGLYRVFEELNRREDGGEIKVRRLYHGSTVHGGQLVGPLEVRRQPIAYYHPASPLADVMRAVPRPCRAAVIGLGSGACAAWFGKGDQLAFYELDPDAQTVARACFTYLKDFEDLAGREALRVVDGDARLRLVDDPARPPGGFDLIVIDAFSSDAIPTHLLTREALQLYEQRLAPGGWLVFHVSTRYHDLRPVLRATSAGLFVGAARERLFDLQPLEYASEWYALRRPQDDLGPVLARGWKRADALPLPAVTPWTDDHANLLAPFWLRVKTRLPAGWGG
jgi:SAM-dependent methyltransferase